MSPEFYSTASITSPWSLKVRLAHIGNSSCRMEHVTVCQKTGVVFYRGVLQVVRVDLTRRRPVPIPRPGDAPFTKSQVNASSPPVKIDISDDRLDSNRVFRMSTKAVSSETDESQHINQSTYIKYCMDCASLAAMQGGILKGFKRDMAYYNLKTFRVEYVGELVAGNDVEVSCWEDVTRPHILYFALRKGETIITKCAGEWYTDSGIVIPKEMSNHAFPTSRKLIGTE